MDPKTNNRVIQFPTRNDSSNKSHALIIGINSAIGLALAKAYQKSHRVVGVARSIHNTNYDFTLVQSDYAEEQLPKLSLTLQNISEQYQVIINCIGLLHSENLQPEKSLQQLSKHTLSTYFYVNSILPALLIKHLCSLLPKKEPATYVNLSAMIGSISDNKIGGWYGYRASKAALNMLVKTASIELSRSHKQTAIIALHPGTTKSRLSAPFTKTTPTAKLYSPELTAERLRKVIDSIDASQTGKFFHWDGSELQW